MLPSDTCRLVEIAGGLGFQRGLGPGSTASPASAGLSRQERVRNVGGGVSLVSGRSRRAGVVDRSQRTCAREWTGYPALRTADARRELSRWLSPISNPPF